MTRDMTVQLSESDTDDGLDDLLSSSHLPPNAEQRDFIRSKEEVRSRRLLEGSKHQTSMRMRGSPTANPTRNSSATDALPSSESRSPTDPGLKDPPSYPSHIQRKADEFVAQEQRQTASKKQRSSQQNGKKSTPGAVYAKTKRATTKKARRSSGGGRSPLANDNETGDESHVEADGPSKAVLQAVHDSDTDSTVSLTVSMNNSEDKDDAAGSDISVVQRSAASTTRGNDYDHSPLMIKKEAQGDIGVPLSLESTPRKFSQLGKCQDDAIVLSSDSETEDGERKPRDSETHVGISEDVKSHGTASISSRFPRRCKLMRWTDAKKKEYKNDHPCIGTKGLPIKKRHTDRFCESCGFCRTCTSPPWCSELKSHEFKEESSQNQTCASATKDDGSNSTTASPSQIFGPGKGKISSNSLKRPALSKRKRSADEKAPRKKAKPCRKRNIGGKKMMGPSTRLTPLNDAMEDTSSAPRYCTSEVRELEHDGLAPAVEGQEAAPYGLSSSMIEESSPLSATPSSPRDSTRKGCRGLQRISKKIKKKKRNKKTKSKGSTDQSAEEICLMVLLDKMRKLEKKVDKQKRFDARFAPVAVKFEGAGTQLHNGIDASFVRPSASEETGTQQHNGIDVSSSQPSATNSIAPEFLKQLEALLKMSTSAQTPTSAQGFPAGSDHMLTHGLESTQNNHVKPDLNQSAHVARTSEIEKISQATERLRRQALAMQGNQDEKDTVHANCGTDVSRQTLQSATQARRQGNCSLLDTAERPQTGNSTPAEGKSTENDSSKVAEIRRVLQYKRRARDDIGKDVNARIRGLRQSNCMSEVVSEQSSNSLESASPPRHFHNRERTQILLLLLIILATATTEPPVLNGIVFILVAFGIILAECGFWHPS